MKMLMRKKSIGIILFVVIVTNLLTYCITVKEVTGETASAEPSDYADNCSYNIKRQSGYDYIKPILFVDDKCESEALSAVKQNVSNFIDESKKIGDLNSGAVYLKEFTGNEWMSVNGDEKYLPGSLMKIPQLITYLKLEESNPGLLNTKFTYDQPFNTGKMTIYNGKTIQLGHSYTVRELLHYMIVESDNNATSLLYLKMDKKKFKEVFTDLGMASPNLEAMTIPITAKEFSIFMRVLYNSSYLSNKNSEFATELMAECKFNQGLVSGLPNDVKVAHKFGEAGDGVENYLCESAIIYLNNNPYVLTIMVKARESKKLPEIIKQLSAIVYQSMRNDSQTTS